MTPEKNNDGVAHLYEELRGAVILTVHETMNEEMTRLRSLVRHIVEEEIAAHKADIAREVMAEIAKQVRVQTGVSKA